MHAISHSRFQNAVQLLPEIRILVVGDLILDEYLFGKVDRISPEAPVPVVWVRKEEITLGGAGNVVKNLNALGTSISVLGRCGQDEKGGVLRKLLEKEGLTPRDFFLLESSTVPTILKTRVIAGHQQVCRVDREEILPLRTEEEEEIFQKFRKELERVQGVVLSDYDKGFLTPSLIENILEEANKKQIPIAVDPQVSHFFLYKKATILTPNHYEAGRALNRNLEDDHSVELACREIRETLDSANMMITRGDKGMTVMRGEDNSVHHIPTVAREVFDVTGAGDTVISVLTAFLASGLDPVEAAIVSNAAAGVVVGKLGAATANLKEIESKLIELDSFLH